MNTLPDTNTNQPPRSLARKLIILLMAVLLLMSAIFFVAFWLTYQSQLQGERREASASVNQLLQASLENAMLKRDIPGLRQLVGQLSEQPQIRDVAILAPNGEVRFSGSDRQIGLPFEESLRRICPDCEQNPANAEAITHFQKDRFGNKVLRSVNPVKNREVCTECHDPVASNPINGILVVDYDAAPVIKKARSSLWGLLAAGLTVIALTSWIVWVFVHRQVLLPVNELKNTSQRLAEGDLLARAKIESDNEFSELGSSFNLMAGRLDRSLQQLLEKEAYLQALIDAVPDSIRVIDENFRIVNTNASYRSQYNCDGENNTCYRSSHHRDTACPPTMITCPVYEIQRDNKAIKTNQTFTLSNGEQTEVQIFAAPLDLEVEGVEKLYIVESIRNLSENIQFSHEQKLASLGELAAGVAHEIRNPLSSIRLALQSTIKKLHNEQDKNIEVLNYLELVDEEVDKCIEVSQRLLNLTTLPGEKQQLVNINRAIEETVSLLNYEATRNQVEIELSLKTPPPRLMAAEYEIRMIILNLVQNAFHAMPTGGKLKISSTEKEGNIIMTFIDNGCGLSADHLPYIFNPFFSKRRDAKVGVGLGLAICKSITERYHGEIIAENNEVKGARFIVKLPSATE